MFLRTDTIYQKLKIQKQNNKKKHKDIFNTAIRSKIQYHHYRNDLKKMKKKESGVMYISLQ